MPAVGRSYLTTGMALVGAGMVTAAQLAPALQESEARVVRAAVDLAAAAQPCTGYSTDGCDISARPVYTPVALNPGGSPANIPANLINAVLSIPRAFVDAVNDLSYSLEVTGNWWVYTPTNVLGFDPADPAKITALTNLFIPFKAISNPLGEQLSWWARANLPTDAGCTGTVGPACADLNSILSKMFQAPPWKLAAGYQFPTIFNPVSDAEGAIGQEIPGSTGAELPWSGAYVKLNPADTVNSLRNYLLADPSTNTPGKVTGADISAALQRLGRALSVFNPIVPMSYLLKGWPYTALTPLFKPLVPILCKQCNPVDPGLPPVAPKTAESTTALVSASTATTPAPAAAAPVAAAAAVAVKDAPDAAGSAEPGDTKAKAKDVAADSVAEIAEVAAKSDISAAVEAAAKSDTAPVADKAPSAGTTVKHRRGSQPRPSAAAAAGAEQAKADAKADAGRSADSVG